MSERTTPASHPRTANAIVHFDICGPQEQVLHGFYGDLLGWEIQPKGPGYALVDTPDGLHGAIIDSDRPAVTLGIAVPDLDAAVRDAERLGGSVVMPPTDNGWVLKAQVKDPAGNLLTLIQS
jgi:predicted enzyme related to lactoylglutathione lyase